MGRTMLEPACVIKLASLACTLLAAGSHAFDFEFASHLFEVADRAGEAGLAFRAARTRDVAGNAVERLRRQVECDCEKWLAEEFRGDPPGLADARAAIASFDFILPRCLPDAAAIVASKYNAEQIATLVVHQAGAAGDDLFREGSIGARILHCLVQRTYEALQADRAFCHATEIPFRAAVLTDLEGLSHDLTGAKAEILAAIHALGVPVPVLRSILEGFGERGAEMDAAQLEQALRAKAGEYHELRARLDRLTNDDPRVQELRQKAGTLIDAGDFPIADATLAEAERLDLAAVEELESLAEHRRASAAATRAERAAAARLRLDYRTEAAHYAAAAGIVAHDRAATWDYRMREACALYDRGDQFGDNRALRGAVRLCRAALALAPRAERPFDWASTENNLGNVLTTLGKREGGTARLEEAVAAFRAALQELTRERAPLHWAMMQNNLGNALTTLGEREGGTARLEEAVAACRAALAERRRERAPFDWAGTQNNLGTALHTLGERESGAARLDEAVTAYRAALAEWTRERVPLQWATAQNNLGNALTTLGEREGGTALLEEAVAAYRAALAERRRERVTLEWATTQNNLGNALWALGEREGETARLHEAVAAWTACLTVADSAWPPEWVQDLRDRIDAAQAEIDRRRAC